MVGEPVVQHRRRILFNDEGRLARTDEINAEIALQQSEGGKRGNLEHKDCTEDHRTVEVMAAPNGESEC
jgi:hypothetical protein